MKKVLCLGMLVVLMAPSIVAAQPRAGDCVIGPGLAATLLFPYFEVTADDPGGVTTLFSVNNGLNGPALTRVVLWTDWGVPTLAFDVYLAGFDVQTINVRDLLNGVIPSTGAGADLSGFPFCAGLPPTHTNPALSMAEREQLQADHQGVAGPLAGDCSGQAHGDGISRGYITVDVVDECSGVEGFSPNFTPANTSFPYFDNGMSTGIATNANVLWGDLFFVDSSGNAAQGMDVVPLWADSTLFSGTDIYTFYGQYSGYDGRDDRVPLPRIWDQRFANGGPFAGGATLIAWQEIGSPPETATCGFSPSWAPFMNTLNSLDEDGGSIFTVSAASLPLVTQRADVSTFGIPYPFGWIQVSTPQRQSWIQPTLTAEGRFSAGVNGTPVEFVCDETPPTP